MSEFWKVFRIEAKKFASNKKALALVTLSPIILVLFFSILASSTITAEKEPVQVCADQSLAKIVEKAGGTLVHDKCEVSISPPGEFYYIINPYENTNRVSKLEEFANSFINEYYYSSIGTTPTKKEKTVLIIGDRTEIINAPPSAVSKTFFGTVTALPIVLFMTLLFGNDYIATTIISQKERRILDILSTYPVRRRTIILAKIALGIVLGFFTMLLFMTTAAAVVYRTKPDQALPDIQLTMPAWGILLSLANTILAIIFTYFITIALAFKTRDPSETSITAIMVSSILNFSLIMPIVTGSLALFKNPAVSLIIPTLIPIQTALLSIIGAKTTAFLLTLYMAAVTFVSYKLLMKEYMKSFE